MLRKRFFSSPALNAAVIYAAFGFLWILLSDRLLLFFVVDQETVHWLQTYKGWFFIGVTAVVIYILLEQAALRLEKSRKRYNRLVKNSVDSLFLTDKYGVILDANTEGCRCLGYSLDELSEMRISDVLQDADREAWGVKVREAVIDECRLFEGRFVRRDGSLFPVEVSVCMFEEDEELYLMCVARDISERKTTEEVLIRNEKMHALEGLAAGMAYEVNNPLTVIIGNSQTTLNRMLPGKKKNRDVAAAVGVDMDQVAEYLRARGVVDLVRGIEDSGNRAAQIVSGIFGFSREGDDDFALCDAGAVLDQAVVLASADYDLIKVYDFNKINIVRKYDPATPPVLCQASKLQQVFFNLLRNGAQAMAEHDVFMEARPTFTLRVHPIEDKVRIEVNDNGPGMPDSVREKVFEPFFTTKSGKGSTGLGLTVSFFIITRHHGGDFRVQSTLGGGSSFIIDLPVGNPA